MNLLFHRIGSCAVAAFAMALIACGPNGGTSADSVGTGGIRSASGTTCDKPGVGCPCDSEGANAACGQVDRISGTYVTCSMGTMACAGGTWGPCIGDRITTHALSRPSDIHLSNLGAPAACAVDPCDPTCNQIADTPSGLDAGSDSGFTVSDAGLTPQAIVSGDGGVVCTGMSISPAAMNVTVTSIAPIVTVPANVSMNASYTPLNCFGGFANASWSIDKQGLAAMANGKLTLVSAVAGPINVSAYSAGFGASAIVNVTTSVVDSSQVTAATAAQFNAPSTQPDSAQFIYPYAQTVFPRAVAAPIVQWNTGGASASAVKVTIQYPATGTPTYSVSVILPESSPPRAALSQDAWAFLDQTAAGQDALISLQRVVSGVLLKPVTEVIHFGMHPLRGNIFYTEYDVTAWTATIKAAKPYGTTPAAIALPNSGCNPCHSVAANGTTLITSNWGNNNTSIAKINSDGSLTGIANMWNATTGSDSRGFAYSAITPDGAFGLQGSNWWGNTLQTNSSQLASTWPHGNGSGLTGAYYANATASGTAAFAENDSTIDFAWASGSPGGSIAAGTSYSVLWTGFVQAIYGETYTFETESSDGVVLTVNGQTLVNQWAAQSDTKLSGTIALSAGAKVPISLRYQNVSNQAQVHLRWKSANQPYEIIRQTQLYPASQPQGLLGTYYINQNLTGSTFSRVDSSVNFNWNGGTPVAGWSASNWSAEWTGTVQPPCAGNYTFCVNADDGARLWVDGVLSINSLSSSGQHCGSAASMTAGSSHALKLDYNQSTGGSYAQLSWSSTCGVSGIVPASALTPSPTAPPTSGLTGTFYSNIDFTGPASTEIDPVVSYNWNGGAPVAGSSGSNLSAEWTGRVKIPCTDNYLFCVVGDDGVRLWVDGTLVDDGWKNQGATWYCNSVNGGSPIAETGGTTHDLKMDYYQGGGGSVAYLYWASTCATGGQSQIIPTANLLPTGDVGTGGYNVAFMNGGDRGTGAPYSIVQIPTIPNSSPVDVSGLSANAWGLGTTALMVPTFSPDGTRLVFVDGDTTGGASWRQGLSVFDFNEAAKTFGNRRNVVSTVKSNNVIRWPAVESDSRSVIYQTNPLSQDDLQYGGMLPSGYSSIPGKLWSVDALDPVNHPPVSLDTVNYGLGGADSNLGYQPSVLPVASGGYRWSVFTSDRQYGNVQNVPTAGVTPTTQLWVSAIDDTVSAGVDRSHPAFWLPNQVLGSGGGRIRNERAYWVLDSCKASLANLNPPVAPTAPSFTPTDQDIGGVGHPGSMTFANGVYTVVAGGDDIWNSSDAFHYVDMPVSGDFQFRARITSLAYADYWSKAGVMLRDNLGSNSAHELMMINAGALTGVQWRSANGGSTNWTQGPGESFPYWVRLTRTGTKIVGDISPDGVNWTTVDTQTPSVGASAYIGLAVTAHNNGTTTTATFDNVGFGATAPPDLRPASVCQDDQDCCGALASPATATCKVDVPIPSPVTRHCMLLASNSCVALGSSCMSDSDCCGFPTTKCTGGVCASPRPPFQYTDLVFTRDYVASCPSQTNPVWRFFDWQTITPGNSDIKFSAATAATAAGLPASENSSSVVSLGQASGAPVTVWTGADVSAALKAAKQSSSFSYLRVFADFQPTSDQSQGPTLTAWRQQYDCAPSE